MAKAQIKRPDGTTITIDGTPQEVAELVSKLDSGAAPRTKASNPSPERNARQKLTLSDLVMLLIDDGYFKKPKDLAAVKAALAEHGHVYPVTTLSPALLRLVQRRYLRRIKQDKRWFYTG